MKWRQVFSEVWRLVRGVTAKIQTRESEKQHQINEPRSTDVALDTYCSSGDEWRSGNS